MRCVTRSSFGDPAPQEVDLGGRQTVSGQRHSRLLSGDHSQQETLSRLARDNGRPALAAAEHSPLARQGQACLSAGSWVAGNALRFHNGKDAFGESGPLGRPDRSCEQD